MVWKRMAAITTMVLCFSATPSLRAQEPAPPEPKPEAPKPEPAPEAAKQTLDTPKKKKDNPFGNRLALYLEFGFGLGSVDSVESSVQSSALSISTNEFRIDETFAGRLAIGWQLPEGHGRYILEVNGFNEDSYRYDAIGFTNQVVSTSGSPTQGAPSLLWWTSHAQDGVLQSSVSAPFWDDTIYGPGDPRYNNSSVDEGEVSYAATPQVSIAKSVPSDLQNQVMTYDALYQREFGGRRVSGQWTAGLRYFDYGGNVPGSAWLTSGSAIGGAGYTDGLALTLMVTNQRSTGFGPTGSAEVRGHFFRKRLTLYGRGGASFVLQTTDVSTGPFLTLVRDPLKDALIPTNANISTTADRSVWQLHGEIGLRYTMLPGFDLIANWSLRSFQSAVLVPRSLLIPDDIVRISQGTSALFTPRDLVVRQWNLGLSYQF